MENFKFIDLFSGIGGFHQAMTSLGGKCVFASEIDPHAINTYWSNYKLNSNNDIKLSDYECNNTMIPEHDVLCAGFPCQAFSKAGYQNGFLDETKGTLFFEIERILKKHKTKYIILENVRNLVSHDNGNTWKTIKKHLQNIGYRLTKDPIILSPHQIGIPQLRDRVYIIGVYDPDNINIPIQFDRSEFSIKKDSCSIDDILNPDENSSFYNISNYEVEILNTWDEFYQGISKKTLGFPIWTDFFKTQPNKNHPEWKQKIIRKNNELYKENKLFIDTWMKKHNNLENFVKTHRKFEWQAGTTINSLWDGVIQFRPSGVRVKKPTCFPALVAMVQIPIIGKYRRRLSVREVAKLQCFPDSFVPDQNMNQAYKQFGNSVNVEVVKRVAKQLFDNY